MLNLISTLASSGGLNVEGPVVDWFKDVVNAISQPQFSLPIFAVLFFVMLALYRYWTKPVVYVPLVVVFGVFYFGSMVIDKNYFMIIVKPDNVPITIMLLSLGFLLWVALRQAAINDEQIRAGKPLIEEDKDDKVLVWPDLVYTELICLVLASALLVLWSILLRAPLESPANPAGPPNPSKAPWYFLGLQEMLVYFDPWMAGVILPGMIVTGLIAMPFIDMNPKGNGYFTLRDRRFAITVWLFGFIILWVVLIVFGTFLRGPNWNFFGPYAYWDSQMQVPLVNVNLSQYFWVFGLKMPEPTNQFGPLTPFVREWLGLVLIAFWIFVLPVILAKTLMRHLYEQMGPGRFYVLAFHFVVMALLPLKMVTRWLFTLKYFIYLPEFNLNL